MINKNLFKKEEKESNKVITASLKPITIRIIKEISEHFKVSKSAVIDKGIELIDWEEFKKRNKMKVEKEEQVK